MSQEITIQTIDSILRKNRIIIEYETTFKSKRLEVSFDKEFFIFLNNIEQYRTTNKLLALEKYNEIKL